MMHLTSLSVPYLKKANPLNSPSVTILTSSQGTSPDPESPLMSVSASMVQMMIKTVALETAYFGIRINGVAIGVTKTATRTK
jgi:NAD(P)-dependent dehydrogenase (short-subunit alcohol dehydrogenase family)